MSADNLISIDPARAANGRGGIGIRILDRIQEAVVATDLDGHIILWNPFAEKLYGWRAEDVIGLSIVDVLAPAFREEADQIMRRLRLGEIWTGEFTCQHRDGRRFVARISNAPLRDSSGVMFGIVGFSAASEASAARKIDIGEGEASPTATSSISSGTRPGKDTPEALNEVIRLSDRSFEITQEVWYALLAHSIEGVLHEAVSAVQVPVQSADENWFRPST